MNEDMITTLLMIENHLLKIIPIISILYLAGSFKKLLDTKEFSIRYRIKQEMLNTVLMDAIFYAEKSKVKDKVLKAKDYFFSNAPIEICDEYSVGQVMEMILRKYRAMEFTNKKNIESSSKRKTTK